LNRSAARPREIDVAVVLAVINAVGGLLVAIAWPDIEDRGVFLVVSAVFSAILLVTAWFLWSGRRWGAIAAIAANALNILLAIPAFFASEPRSLAIGAAISIALSAGTIVLALMPAGRAYWKG